MDGLTARPERSAAARGRGISIVHNRIADRLAIRTLLVCGLVATAATAGCTLRHYRLQADDEAYRVVEEKSTDPRWDRPDFTIQIDPRSRYFDGYDPDRPPMPPDDPTSHEFMHYVDDMKGWSHWHRFGDRLELENPYWREALNGYVDLTPDGKVKLSLDSALLLAYVNSPTYQDQLETVYLSALDVTTERFRFETQFFGGNTTTYDHLGRLRPGGETNLLTTENDFTVRRRFATAGELLVGFANSFVWQFTGPDTNASLSILNFNLVQPLLRSAGRERALETLTRVERGLLGNLRQLEQYRQGFYTQLAVGTLGVRSVSRLGGFTGGTGLTGFTGTGVGGLGGVGQATQFGGGFFRGGAEGAGGGAGLAGGGAGQVGGFVGLLQSLQEIRNTQYSLDLQLRTLALLEANLEAGTIDLTQVDQFRQNIETLRAQLLQARAGLQTGLDNYKTGSLGLPPDLEVDLDDSFIGQFQLIDPRITTLQDAIADFQSRLGALPANPDAGALRELIEQAEQLLGQYGQQFEVTQRDLERMRGRTPVREARMTEEERTQFGQDMQQVTDEFAKRPAMFSSLQQQLRSIRKQLDSNDTSQSLNQLVGWVRVLGDEIQSISLIQARARLETIVVEPIELDAKAALGIARANRLDYMNARASLVDSWRLISFNADQLQSVLDVQLRGDVRTTGDNPVKFQAPTGNVQASLQFDAPFTRLLERNNYRQSLVDYQQNRRGLIQFDDTINQSVRARLRDLEQLRVNLEIQRRAVVISIRRVDFTRSELNRPLPAAAPGEPPATFGPTAVQNLLSALSDLSNAQNNFMSVWLNYYAGRLQLVRDLGIMQLDEQGRWIDRPIDEILQEICAVPTDLPPDVPHEWWEMVEPGDDALPGDQQQLPAPDAGPVHTPVPPTGMRGPELLPRPPRPDNTAGPRRGPLPNVPHHAKPVASRTTTRPG